ncbi:MAG: hypothetical protein QM820_23140 [Minicystis sp.]
MVSARITLRNAAGAALALGAAALLGACDLLLRVGQPDRYVDPHVSCEDGPCRCVGGFDDCDGDEDNGCETDLSGDPQNCGACGNACDNGACNGGSCACNEGFVDCDGNASTGCEAEPAADPKNCGACGHDCAGGLCVAGVCQPVTVGGLEDAESLAVADGFVYVARCSDPPVARVPADGGMVEIIGAAAGCAHLVAVTSETALWATDDLVLWSSLGYLPTAMQLAMDTSPAKLFAASPTHVYWFDDDAAKPALVRVAIAGGAVETVAETTPTALTVDGDLAYWSDAKGIHAVPSDSLNISDLSPMTARSLAVAGDTVFAADAQGIVALSLAGGTATSIQTTAGAEAIAADATHVYWADTSDGTVRRVERDGAGLVVLSKGESFATPPKIALDDRAAYWIAGQKVRKVAK